jgi:hypothetical protein
MRVRIIFTHFTGFCLMVIIRTSSCEGNYIFTRYERKEKLKLMYSCRLGDRQKLWAG